MKSQPDTTGIDHGERAVDLARLGYKLVVVRPGSKAPLMKGWQTTEYTHDELCRLFADPRLNVGIRTGGDLVVLDIDTSEPEKVEWVRERVGDTPMKVRTPSGGQHWYFGTRKSVAYGNGVKLRGEPFDLRWDGTQAVCPWSRNSAGTAYQWAGPVLPVAELPKFRVSSLREYKRRKVQKLVRSEFPPGEGRIKFPEKYCLTIRSVQGQNGSGDFWRVVCILHEARRTREQAFDYLRSVWNPACAEPIWSDREINHALDRRYGK